jgi:hypothetical protein
MPVEHPATAPSEVHSPHSDGWSCRSHLTDGRSHHAERKAVSHRTYTDTQSHHTDNQSYHTSHAVEGNHANDTHTKSTLFMTMHLMKKHEKPPQDTSLSPPQHEAQRPSTYAPHPISTRWALFRSRCLQIPTLYTQASSSKDIYELPWVASRVTVDYVPAELSHARYGRRVCRTLYPD